MTTILHARRESTKTAELPAGHPFGDWTDGDFDRFEARLAADRAGDLAAPGYLLDSDLELLEPDPDCGF